MAQQADAPSSSSDRSTRLDSTRTNEEEEEEQLLLRLARLPEPLRPQAQRYQKGKSKKA